MSRKPKPTSSNRTQPAKTTPNNVSIDCRLGDGRPTEIERLERLERLNVIAERAMLGLGRNTKRGHESTPTADDIRNRIDSILWHRKLADWKTLPSLDQIWQMMHDTGLPNVPKFPGEPKTETEAIEGLQVAKDWCRAMKSAADAQTGRSKTAALNALSTRSAARRNEWFARESKTLKPAAIRDKWNAMSPEQREAIDPVFFEECPRGKHGSDRVRKGIEAHQKRVSKESEKRRS